MNELEAKIVTKLKEQIPPKQIAEELDISINKVRYTKKKFNDEIIEYILNKTTQSKDPVRTIQTEVEANKELLTESAIDEIKEKLQEPDKIVNGVEGLKKLDLKFQETISLSLDVAKAKLENPDITTKEWAIISDTVSKMYSAVYNKNNTNVNIFNQSNTVVANDKLQIFKAKVGV